MARRRLPYGSKAALDQALLLSGEVATDVTDNRFRIGDGVTPGGVPQARLSDVLEVQADLDAVRDAIPAGMKGYATFSALPAMTAADDGFLAKVEDTQKVYRWNGSTLAWVEFDDPTLDAAVRAEAAAAGVASTAARLDQVDDLAVSQRRAIDGAAVELNDWVHEGYIARATGALTANSGWRCTGFMAVNPATVILRDGTVIAPEQVAAGTAFYDASLAYLGAAQLATGQMEATVGSFYPTARFVRFSRPGTDTTGVIRLKDPAAMRRLAEVDVRLGGLTAWPLVAVDGYISAADGSEQASVVWKRTGLMTIPAGAYCVLDAAYHRDAARATVAVYDGSGAYLGAYSPRDRHERWRPSDLFAGAVSIRLSWVAALGTPNFHLIEQQHAGAADMVFGALLHDYFTDADVEVGIYSATGTWNAGGNWRTTAKIPCEAGDIFQLTTNAANETFALVMGWDERQALVGPILLGGGGVTARTNTRIEIPAGVAFVTASGAATAPYRFIGVARTGRDTATAPVSAMIPSEAYALQGEPLYIYPRGMVADRSLDLTLSVSGSNEDVAVVTPTSTSDIPVTVRVRGEANGPQDVGTFNVRVTGTPVNPAARRNILCLGDSLTEGANSIQGAWVNEMSRRLNGTGTALSSGAQSPAALALSNMQVIGTRGNEPVKHEGRSGWAISHYLLNTTLGGISNAFWDPANSRFDLAYYLSQNGFDGVVNATGSNLTVVILLGWNDVYTKSAATSAAHLGLLIDRIRATHVDADIIVVGLNPAPRTNVKAFTGERYVSEREVFELIRSFGVAYQQVCQAKTRCDFLQISHVFQPEVGYLTTTQALSGRSTVTQTGSFDHVHPGAIGYAMIADAVFYKLLYDYCR